jgi:hypothetical protein
MSTQYIIKFSRNEDDQKLDGYVELKKETYNNIPCIAIRSRKNELDDNNVTWFHKLITNNFASVDFNDDHSECYLNYKEGFSRSLDFKSTISFDKSSSSAYSTFKKVFTELLNSKCESEYYSNGRLLYTGEVLYKENATELKSRVPNGDGTLYYDNLAQSAKYMGEFEDGKYDGGGMFFSKDGNLKLRANNISNGIPTQKGKLHISFPNVNEVVELNFREMWEKLNLTSKDSQRNFVLSDNFVNKVTSLYWKHPDLNMNQLEFVNMNVKDQQLELWNEVKSLQEMVKQNKEAILKTSNEQQTSFTKTLLMMFILNFGITFLLNSKVCYF